MVRGLRGPHAHASYVLDRSATIGRAAAADIQILDQRVSRQHARLLVEGQRVTLIDLSSNNGTFIHGHQIHRRVLKTGDRFQIGVAEYVFEEIQRDKLKTSPKFRSKLTTRATLAGTIVRKVASEILTAPTAEMPEAELDAMRDEARTRVADTPTSEVAPAARTPTPTREAPLPPHRRPTPPLSTIPAAQGSPAPRPGSRSPTYVARTDPRRGAGSAASSEDPRHGSGTYSVHNPTPKPKPERTPKPERSAPPRQSSGAYSVRNPTPRPAPPPAVARPTAQVPVAPRPTAQVPAPPRPTAQVPIASTSGVRPQALPFAPRDPSLLSEAEIAGYSTEPLDPRRHAPAKRRTLDDLEVVEDTVPPPRTPTPAPPPVQGRFDLDDAPPSAEATESSQNAVDAVLRLLALRAREAGGAQLRVHEREGLRKLEAALRSRRGAGNRRRWARLPCRLTAQVGEATSSAMVTDIGAGGISIEGAQLPIAPGDAISVRVSMGSDHNARTAVFQTKVVWVDALQGAFGAVFAGPASWEMTA